MIDFKSDNFAIEIMAKGSFIDAVASSTFMVEAYTIRLNHIALNEWILSEMMNTRDCYDTEEEWEEHKAEYKTRRADWIKKIRDALGIDPEATGVSITQAQSEIFTVVHIWGIK